MTTEILTYPSNRSHPEIEQQNNGEEGKERDTGTRERSHSSLPLYESPLSL